MKKTLIRLVLALGTLITSPGLFAQGFTEQTGIVLNGMSLGSVSWGDYDNDGDLDIMAFGSINGYQNLYIYRNNGDNTFTVQAGLFSPAIPTAIDYYYKLSSKWCDLNNDGYIDIILCGFDSNGRNIMMIYQNNSASSFILKQKIPFLVYSGSPAFDAGDYDNDGDIDIVMERGSKTSVYANQGGFLFQEQASVSLQGFMNGSCRWGDYDNDGDPDLVLTGDIGASGSLYKTSIYRNDGNNIFTLQTGITLQNVSGGSADWGDFNADGFADLLISGNGVTKVYRNNGNNTFTDQTGYNLQGLRQGMTRWGDLDNDGDLDIIITGDNYNSVLVTKLYKNNGDGTFTEITGSGLVIAAESFIDAGDYDNDGDLDIVMTGKNGTSLLCKVYKNNTTLTNAAPGQPQGITSVASGNDVILKWKKVTGDNTPAKSLSYNLMVGTVSGGINTVSPASSASGNKRYPSMGNAQLDTTFLLRNLKKGTYYWKVQAIDNSFKGGAFSAQGTFTYAASFQSYGLKASAVGGKEASVEWSRGNGDYCIVFAKQATTGTAAPTDNTTYSASTSFGAGTQIGTSGWYCVYKGTLSTVKITGLTSLTDYIIQVQEFTGTAGAEKYYTGITSQNSVTFRTGIFTILSDLRLPGVGYPSLSFDQISNAKWFDSDNDSDLDFYVMGPTGFYLYRNDGNQVFTKVTLSLPGGSFSSICDYNNDGLTDITFTDHNSTKIFTNSGSNTFTELAGTSISVGSYGAERWSDFDNDGDLDLLLVGEDASMGCLARLYRNNGNSTFTEVMNHNITPVRYGTVCWGDFDNDGFTDLALSGIDITGKYINLVIRNNTNGTFSTVSDLTTAANGIGPVEWGDYDNDGDLDLLKITESKNKIFRNDGNNIFTYQSAIDLGASNDGSGAWGDYDNDGYPDILVSGFDAGHVPFTKIFRNNGNNTFSEVTSCILPPAGNSSSAWGDFDKDGDLDILLTGHNSDSTITLICRNDIGTANIAPAAPAGLSSVVTKSDVKLTWKAVKTDNTGYKAMTYNLKVGTTSGGTNIVTPHSASTGFRKLAEMGNGFLDTTFLLKNLPFGTYYWSVQAVDNSFAGSAFPTQQVFSIVPVQARGLNATITGNSSLMLRWERGNGTRCIVFCKEGSSGNSLPVNSKSYVADSEFGYGEQIGTTGWYCLFNGRSDSVAVTGLKYRTDYIFHVVEYTGTPGAEQYFTELPDGNPGVFSTGIFSEQTAVSLNAASFNNYAWGDYDNDGFTDILIPGLPCSLYKNNGNNTFTKVTQAALPTGVSYGGGYWGDYDNDGDLDILLTGSFNDYGGHLPAYSRIYRNDGGGIFTLQSQIALTGVDYSAADWGDYDSDGYLDIIICGATGADPNFNPVTKIYHNNGNGTFTEQTQISLPGVFKGEVKWVDYDNDGDLDLHIAGGLDYLAYNHCISKIYRNDGNGVFTFMFDLPGLWEASVDWSDYDNDGDPDVVMTAPGDLYLYRNDISTFTQIFAKFYPYSSNGGVCWGDYNNDSYPDILFTNFAAASIIFTNNKGLDFTEFNDGSFKITMGENIRWCDYDNDGDIDLLTNQWGSNCRLFRNNLVMKSGSFRTNRAPYAISGLKSNYSPGKVTLAWNPVRDDESPYRSLTYNVRIGKTKTGVLVQPSNSDAAGFRRVVAVGNAYSDTTSVIKALVTGKYYWSVQAVDQAFRGGIWAPVDSFEVKTVQAFFTADTVCHGVATTFTENSVAVTGIASWKWKFGDGTTASSKNTTHVFETSGDHFVTLVITDNAGKKDSLSRKVVVKPKPGTAFTAPPVCQGSAMSITNNTVIPANISVVTWLWNFGDGETSLSNDPKTHGYLSAGSYQVSLKAVASNGCEGVAVKTVLVAANPVADITADKLLSICQGDNVKLSVTYKSNYTYTWKRNNLSVPGGNANTYNADLQGSYTVEVINTEAGCPTVSSPASVSVRPAPYKPDVQTFNYTQGKCPGENPVRLNVPDITGYSYLWYKDNFPQPRDTLPYFDTYESGEYTLRVGLNGCYTLSDPQNITFPEAFAKPLIYAQGPTVWYLACNNTGAASYKWYFNGKLIEDAKQYFYVANHRLGEYQVSIGNSEGCFVRSDILRIPPGSTGEDEITEGDGAIIYPNPGSGLFNLRIENGYYGNLTVRIIGHDGKEIIARQYIKAGPVFEMPFDLSEQSPGSLLIRIETDRSEIVKKIIIK